MKRWRLFGVMAALLLCCMAFVSPAEASGIKGLECTGSIAVCSVSQEKVLRYVGDTADLSKLGTDETYSFVLNATYNGSKSLKVKNFYVRVDGGEKWGWSFTSLEPGKSYTCHIYSHNMQKVMTAGAHKAVWYVNDKAVLTQTFTFTAPTNWYSRFTMPSSGEIANTNKTAAVRSPYLYGWLKIDQKVRYTEYSADFKADYVPKATYCALINVEMDLSYLKKRYKNVHTEYNGVHMYGGFQRRWNEYNTIVSAWDVYYTDANGVEHTLRAKQLYPDKTYIGDGTFGGEGTGMQILVPFDWEAGHWYRMLLQCHETESGTTAVEQWVCDLETGDWTLMARYDTLIPDSCFVGPCAFFLENFDPDYAGEIRTMEVRNVRIRNASTGKWQAVKTATIGSNGGMPSYNGSYNYGADADCFWMITSGAGGDWFGTKKAPANNKSFSVKNGSTASPY